jgi:hypothetical protein
MIMAISPSQEEKLAIEIRRIYMDAEIRLLQMIAKRLVSGSGDVAEWQKEKMNQLSAVIREAQKIVGGVNRKIPKEIAKIIELAYLAGDESAADDLTKALEAIKEGEDIPEDIQMTLFPDDPDPKIDIDGTMATFSGINTGAVEVLAAATTETLASASVPIVREIDDIYRRVVTTVAGSPLTGVETRREATQRILDQFAKSGIKVFAGKRTWNIASYSEMATRSAIGQASVQGHLDKMEKMGFDLVQVSDHHEECDLCRPWEGKILSRKGGHPKYKSLAEAIRGGLFHPNCGHRLNTYFEGLTKPLTKTKDPKGYEERKHQRYLERTIREWKRRQALAQTDQAKATANKKVAEWNDRMKAFIDDTGRRRKREREQNKRAR